MITFHDDGKSKHMSHQAMFSIDLFEGNINILAGVIGYGSTKEEAHLQLIDAMTLLSDKLSNAIKGEMK
jgi:hypothetical protein